MKRRKFLQSSLTAGLATTIIPVIGADNNATEQEIYEWREYEIRFGSDQQQLDNYFKSALIPALNKYGVKAVGVFKELVPSEPAKFYLLTPYSSLDNYLSVNTKVKMDADYIENSATYNSIPEDKALYDRFKSSLMIAFEGWPKITIPSDKSRIFELRTYEGYSEDAVKRKIKMFHDGEFPIFKRAKLNPVFCGEVIAGDRLPRLTYLITCKNMEERNKGWVNFIADPEWKKLVSDPQYANTISKINNTFLIPTTYSQV